MTAPRNASAQRAPLSPALTYCVVLMKSVTLQTTLVGATGVDRVCQVLARMMEFALKQPMTPLLTTTVNVQSCTWDKDAILKG